MRQIRIAGCRKKSFKGPFLFFKVYGFAVGLTSSLYPPKNSNGNFTTWVPFSSFLFQCLTVEAIFEEIAGAEISQGLSVSQFTQAAWNIFPYLSAQSCNTTQGKFKRRSNSQFFFNYFV